MWLLIGLLLLPFLGVSAAVCIYCMLCVFIELNNCIRINSLQSFNHFFCMGTIFAGMSPMASIFAIWLDGQSSEPFSGGSLSYAESAGTKHLCNLASHIYCDLI